MSVPGTIARTAQHGLAVAIWLPLLVLTSACLAPRQQPSETGPQAARQGRGGSGARDDEEQEKKPYSEVVTAEAVTDSRLFIVHRVDEKLLF